MNKYNFVVSCVLCCAILSYPLLSYPIFSSPIPSHPIQRYPTPSYPITLDGMILHPGPFLSYLILSNLIVYDPGLTHAYHVSSQSIQSKNILPVFCIASYSTTLFLFAVAYHHSATRSNLPISLLSPSHSSPPHFHPLLLDEIVHRAVLPTG